MGGDVAVPCTFVVCMRVFICMWIHERILHVQYSVDDLYTGLAVQFVYCHLSYSLGLAPLKMYGELQCNMGPY